MWMSAILYIYKDTSTLVVLELQCSLKRSIVVVPLLKRSIVMKFMHYQSGWISYNSCMLMHTMHQDMYSSWYSSSSYSLLVIELSISSSWYPTRTTEETFFVEAMLVSEGISVEDSTTRVATLIWKQKRRKNMIMWNGSMKTHTHSLCLCRERMKS